MAWSTSASPAIVVTLGGFVSMVIFLFGDRALGLQSGGLPLTVAERCMWLSPPSPGAQGGVRPANSESLEKPAQRFETEQQATGHLVGSQRPDHMLIGCQDV